MLKYNKPLFFDGARFAENAYFIKLKEKEYKNKTILEIIQEMFSYVDGMTMSAKKDGLANIGGWLALNNDKWAEKAYEILLLTEGFRTYGGLSGRDLAAISIGLREVINEDYLRYRIQSTKYLGDALHSIGFNVVQPVGGHAVYIDAKAMLPHIKPLQYPAQSLVVELYKIGGIRAGEIGSLMFGMQPDGTEKAANNEFVRLAIPRRVYTKSHLDYTIDIMRKIYKSKNNLRGLKIVDQPKTLRHFTAKLAPLK